MEVTLLLTIETSSLVASRPASGVAKMSKGTADRKENLKVVFARLLEKAV